MREFDRPNAPLNVPALEALERLTGIPVPMDIKEQILDAPFRDDLSGLRLLAHRLHESDPYDWSTCPQPKKQIGEYVESMGFRVPKRYETLDEALAAVQQGVTIVLRSEHPQEYDSFSGLLESHRLDSDTLKRADSEFTRAINNGASEEDVLHLAKWDGISKKPMMSYLSLTDKKPKEYYDEMSFSFWEYIPGRNLALVADDVIEGRYHITSYGTGGRGGAVGGIFNEVGEPFSREDKVADSLSDIMSATDIARLIAEYEQIRVLPRFSERQCPIMEMQLGDDDTLWFLQYHKARPFRLSTDRLDAADYPSEEGWLKAQAVRGALGQFVTLQTAIWYPDGYKPTHHYRRDSDFEDASFDLHPDVGLSEYLARRRTAFFSIQNAAGLYSNMADGCHELRSRWYKPFSSIAIGRAGYEHLISRDKIEELAPIIFRENKMGRFAIDTASDGLTGFVRLNPDYDQPADAYS